jgi:MoaA/NifB/PqqE/SkfB family radical SAM enzyme
MCSNPSEFQNRNSYKDYNFDVLKQRIDEINFFDEKNNIIGDKIILTGGEPTIHPDFFGILSFIRKKFPEVIIELDTNGRRFYYPSFTKRVLRFERINIYTSLHGFDAKTHDAITRTPGSFLQTVKGIENILKYKKLGLHELELRIIITKLTYQYIEKILKFIKEDFPQVDRIVLIFMEMEGQAGDNFKIVGLTYSQFQKSIPKIAKWIPKFKEFRFYHFPLCTIDYSLWRYTWRTLPAYEVTFLPKCKTCLYKKYCLSIHKDYLKKVGGEEFKPIRKKYIIKEVKYFHHPIQNVFIE